MFSEVKITGTEISFTAVAKLVSDEGVFIPVGPKANTLGLVQWVTLSMSVGLAQSQLLGKEAEVDMSRLVS